MIRIRTRNAVEPVPVPENVRGLLCAIAYGWIPDPIVLGRVESLQYKGADLTDLAQDVQLHADRLRVTLGGTDVGRLLPFQSDGQWEGTLVGGARFHADTVLHFGHSVSLSHAGGAQRLLTVEAGRWTVLEGEPPSLWVGRVHGSINIDFGGNLAVERVAADGIRGGGRRHFRLKGVYQQYLVQTRARPDVEWHLVVDTGSARMPDPEALGRDFLALQFVLGRQLRMPTLLGVREDRRTVACTLGCSTRNSLEGNTFPPVPIERNNDDWVDEAWA